MKVTIQNKKGLEKNIKVLIDKKTMETYMDNKYEEIKKKVVLKGFRPGKVPKEVLKKINLIYKTTIKLRASGGIGIRAGLRNQCRKA